MKQKTDLYMSFVSMRVKNLNRNKWLILLTLLIISFAICLLNYLTPLYMDDYAYMYIIYDTPKEMYHQISSFSDVLISQYNHYFFVNGRSVVHTIVQLFLGLWGKDAFNIVNTIVFVAFIYLVTRISAPVTARNLSFSAILILLLYPSFGLTVLWLSGSVNYLWSSVAVCAFMYALDKLRDAPLRSIHFFWGGLCLFAGWTHEGITFPLAISLGIYVIINRKNICKQAILPLIACFIIGVFLCSFSPGTIGRANAGNGITISDILQRFAIGVRVCVQLKAIYVLLFVVILSYYVKQNSFRPWIKKIYADNIIVCDALIFSFGVVFFSKQTSARCGIGIELFAIILILRILTSLNIKYLKPVKTVICIGGGVLYCVILFCSIQNWLEYQNIKSQLNKNDSDIIIYKDCIIPDVLNSYIVNIVAQRLSPNYWHNKYMSVTYKRKSLIFISSEVFNDIINSSDKISDINKQKDYSCYVVRLDNAGENIHPKFILNLTNYAQVHWSLRLIKYIPAVAKMLLFTETEIDAYFWRIINVQGHDYAIIEKDHLVDDRVKDIMLESTDI